MIQTSVFCDEISGDFEEQIKLSVEAGARHVELRSRIFGCSVQNCSDDQLDLAHAILHRYGAAVAVIGSPIGKCVLGDDDEWQVHVKWFERVCALAHRFETRLIRGFAFWTPSRQELPRPVLDDVIEEIARRLTPIAQIAIDQDVLLCLECEGSTCSGTCGEIARIIEAVKPNDNLMVAWDCNNAASLGEHPLREGYPLVRERVKHVHVKPNRCRSIETVGDVEDTSYEDIFRTLLADGYEGYATVEHWGSRWLMLEGVRQTEELLTRIQAPAGEASS